MSELVIFMRSLTHYSSLILLVVVVDHWSWWVMYIQKTSYPLYDFTVYDRWWARNEYSWENLPTMWSCWAWSRMTEYPSPPFKIKLDSMILYIFSSSSSLYSGMSHSAQRALTSTTLWFSGFFMLYFICNPICTKELI